MRIIRIFFLLSSLNLLFFKPAMALEVKPTPEFIDVSSLNSKNSEVIEVSVTLPCSTNEIHLDKIVRLVQEKVKTPSVKVKQSRKALQALMPDVLQESALDTSLMNLQKSQIFHPVCKLDNPEIASRNLTVVSEGDIKIDTDNNQKYIQYLHDNSLLRCALGPNCSISSLVGSTPAPTIPDRIGNAGLLSCKDLLGLEVVKKDQITAAGQTKIDTGDPVKWAGDLARQVLKCLGDPKSCVDQWVCELQTKSELTLSVQPNVFYAGAGRIRENVAGESGHALGFIPGNFTDKKFCRSAGLEKNQYNVGAGNYELAFYGLGESNLREDQRNCLFTPDGVNPDCDKLPLPEEETCPAQCADPARKAELEANFGRFPPIVEPGNTMVTFSWEPVPGVTKYKVDFQPVSNGDNDATWEPHQSDWSRAVEGTNVILSLTYQNQPDCGTDYWWRVLATDDCGAQIRAKKTGAGYDANFPGFDDRGVVRIPCR